MKLLLAAALALGSLGIAGDAPLCAAGIEQAICCKKCKAGKPCGDSCIAKDKKCEKPRGCACQA